MDIDTLVEEKIRAVAEEDFLRAADAGILEEEKKQAIEEEDYFRAADLKKQIELLTLEQSKGDKKSGNNNATPSPVLAPQAKPSVSISSTLTASSNTSPTSTNNELPPVDTDALQKDLSLKSPFGRPSTSPTKQSSAARSFQSTSGRLPNGGNKLSLDRSSVFNNSSSPPNSSTRSEDLNNNPIKTDSQLKTMIDGLDDVDSFRFFKFWKSSFLNRFEDFLTEEGAKPAQAAYSNFRNNMKHFIKYVKQVQQFVENGDLTVERTTVKGRNSLNEMNKWLVNVIAQERSLIPAKREEEEQRGYTKFHLGALLVRDGFKEHEQLNVCCEILNHMRSTSLANVADRQQLEEMDNFDAQTIRFQDLMADLGLYEVMMKCWELGAPEDEFIFVDLKTGAVGAVGIQSCLDKGFIHTIQDDEENTMAYRETITDQDDREAILDLVKEVLEV